MVIRNPDTYDEDSHITTSEVRQQLAAHLTRLWRTGWCCPETTTLLKNSCSLHAYARSKRARSLRRVTRIDRWLFSILHSIWISDLRARRVRLGQGFVESEELLAPDTRERDDERLHFQKIMQRVSALPEAQRNTVFLVYVEGLPIRKPQRRWPYPSAPL